jgi:hypothetical protein
LSLAEQFGTVEALKERLGVTSWPDLTKDQTYELLKLAGQEQFTNMVLAKIVELAPTFRDLSIQCFETFRETAKSMNTRQKQALEIMNKALESFDRFRASLLDMWKTTNDPERIAKFITQVSKQMIEILVIVERMNADNNRSWRDALKNVAKVLAGLIALGGAAAVAVAQNRK